ncbi:MAG TPA: hypothetical protein VHH73_01470 [Verrucomicrobiae bacterium]|nr:hypothetical protein [Verrucomicrobiae bacterium]
MKIRGFWIIAGLALLTALTAQTRGPATRALMREKLTASQKVLEGLALEDLPLVAAKAEKLGAMSQEAAWRVLDNPEYDRLSLDFRRNANDLAQAARKKNLDGATLAYMKMTMSCVECHKLVRGKLVAALK